MNGKDLFYSMAYIDETYIDRAENGTFSPAAFQRDVPGRRIGFRRTLLIAATIALIGLLVGCGVIYMLTMQNMKLEDRQWLDANEPFTQRVLSTGSPQGTANYQAAKEWQDYVVPYTQSHEWDASFVCPTEYQLYHLNSQEMVIRLEEILKKYDLKPMGPEIKSDSAKGLLDYLGIQEILLPGAPASVTNLQASYYEGGRLGLSCRIQMEDGDGRWPYETYTACRFTPKGYFDDGVFVLDHPENWKEWNYTTHSGEAFLILYNPAYYEAYAVCDRGDRMITVEIVTAKEIYEDNQFSDEMMSQKQVEQLLDLFDFSVKPVPGDTALLAGLPGGSAQTFDGCTIALKEAVSDGNKAWVKLGITVPEGSSVPIMDTDNGQKYWGIRLDRVTLKCSEAEYDSCYAMRFQDDGDGLDHTLECLISWDKQEPDENLDQGARWTLILDGMQQEVYNQEKQQHETQWENNHLWKFDFTFDDTCDYRTLKFITHATELPAVIGQTDDCADLWGSVTAQSLTLHANSAALILKEPLGYGSLSSWNGEETINPMVVLKDGSTIALLGDSGFSLDESNTICQENLLAERTIALNEVDHIALVDGTILKPQ